MAPVHLRPTYLLDVEGVSRSQGVRAAAQDCDRLIECHLDRAIQLGEFTERARFHPNFNHGLVSTPTMAKRGERPPGDLPRDRKLLTLPTGDLEPLSVGKVIVHELVQVRVNGLTRSQVLPKSEHGCLPHARRSEGAGRHPSIHRIHRCEPSHRALCPGIRSPLSSIGGGQRVVEEVAPRVLSRQPGSGVEEWTALFPRPGAFAKIPDLTPQRDRRLGSRCRRTLQDLRRLPTSAEEGVQRYNMMANFSHRSPRVALDSGAAEGSIVATHLNYELI